MTELHLAPMLGITDVCFRNSFSKHFGGFDASIAPFIKVNGKGEFKSSKFEELRPKNNRLLLVTPQVMANKFYSLESLFSALQNEFGYQEFNWNLGCPSPTSSGRGMGCGLMPDVELIDSILGEVFGKLDVKLSIKTRLGLSSSNDIFNLIETLNKYPVENLIIHARTGEQGYSGSTDLETFEKAYHLSKARVSYSGDVTSFENYDSLLKRLPNLKAVYIGRGILKNPLLARSIKEKKETPSFDGVYADTYASFITDLTESYLEKDLGLKQALIRAKTCMFYLADHFQFDKKSVKQIKKAREVSELISALYN